MQKAQVVQVTCDIYMVPCAYDEATRSFIPIETPFGLDTDLDKKSLRKHWNDGEDERLRTIVEMRGSKCWTAIAKELNDSFQCGRPIRDGKQCRERYNNHLDPYLNRGPWTEREDELILQMEEALGKRWSKIAKQMNGRNENQIKNRFKQLQRHRQASN